MSPSLLARLETSLRPPDWYKLGFGDGLTQYDGVDHPGCKPWLIALKRNTRRYGPASIPSYGPPIVFAPRRGLVLNCMPTQELLSAGIPVGSYESFANSTEGLQVVKEKSCTLYLPALSVCYVPAGYTFGVVFYKQPDKCVGKKVAELEAATMLVTPMPFSSQLKEMSGGVRAALLN